MLVGLGLWLCGYRCRRRASRDVIVHGRRVAVEKLRRLRRRVATAAGTPATEAATADVDGDVEEDILCVRCLYDAVACLTPEPLFPTFIARVCGRGCCAGPVRLFCRCARLVLYAVGVLSTIGLVGMAVTIAQKAGVDTSVLTSAATSEL